VLKLVQISDIHLLVDTNGELLGVKTQESLQAVIDLIKRQHKDLDLILLTGDLSQDGSTIAYQRLAQMFKVFNLPTYYVPGNHDDSEAMLMAYPHENILNEKQIVQDHWQIILLDSHLPRKVHGYLDEIQLGFLDTCLKQYPDHHALIVFHHQPMKIQCAWLDKLGLTNAEEFWEIVKRYPQVRHVLYGHIHQENQQTLHNVTCYALPSTCIQFKPKQDHFGLDNIPPGYRYIELHADGQLKTKVERVAHYIGKFDANAKGY